MRTFLFFINLFYCITVYTQVGINTTNPLGIFHIDAGTPGDTSDDFIVTSSGYVGIGTNTPTSMLHIKSNSTKALRLVDTSQNDGYVLMSDAIGNATWKPGPSLSVQVATLPTTNTSVVVSSSSASSTIIGSLTITSGTWLISYNFMLKGVTATTGIGGAMVRDDSSGKIYSSVNQIGNQNSDAILSNSFMIETSTTIDLKLRTSATSGTPHYWASWAVPQYFTAAKLSD